MLYNSSQTVFDDIEYFSIFKPFYIIDCSINNISITIKKEIKGN